MNDIRLSDSDLVLRSATTDDADQLTAWWNDGAVMAHAGFPLGLGQDVATTRSQIAAATSHGNVILIIEVGEHPIGEMNYRLTDGIAEIGIKICDASQQNRGIGSRALTLLIDHLFDARHVDQITLDTNLDNVRAQHVYERLGFRRVRENRDASTDQLGVPQSSVAYALEREAWRGAAES